CARRGRFAWFAYW
nr:immunoglobulin heavy chain junction region [Mus musculus]